MQNSSAATSSLQLKEHYSPHFSEAWIGYIVNPSMTRTVAQLTLTFRPATQSDTFMVTTFTDAQDGRDTSSTLPQHDTRGLTLPRSRQHLQTLKLTIPEYVDGRDKKLEPKNKKQNQ